MKMNPFRRVMTAVCISLAINMIWLLLDAMSVHQEERTSMSWKIVSVLGGPGGALADWLTPPGHDAAHFLGGILMAIGFSFVFYAGIAWIIISLPAWWRERT
jgi:hypothetical protein